MNFSENKVLSNLNGIFFISGFSALIYQVCWQRLLFTGFGIDLASITLIVSIFMIGLGVGAFFGGRIADKFRSRIILIFCFIELSIGFFGFFSRELILVLQDYLTYSNLFQVAFFSLLLLLFPTFLMGATLPILTKFFDNYINNIGESIGTLYFYNTLGAAFGALSTGFIFFNYLGLSSVIYIAAILNMCVAIIVFSLYGGDHNEKL